MRSRSSVLSIASCFVLGLSVVGYTQAPPETPRKPQQAGQPLDPLTTAARMAAIRGGAMTGNQEVVRQQMEGFHDDFRRSIKLADATRKVDREATRTAARTVTGVRSVVWIDHENLLAIVEGNEQRSQATIDAICMQMEPLGDTLGVVVNLQSGAARNGDELEILSRNCQLAPGDRALLQSRRQVDVIAPQMRAQHLANNVLANPSVAEDADAAVQVLEESTPEM